MAVTKVWRVYGAEGHRQRESFSPSARYDWSQPGAARVVEIENADKTGTNDFSVVRITRESAEECAEELRGQLCDGIFESSRTGTVEEIM